MKKFKIEQLSVAICSAAFFLLAVIWVLPGTIGIRHYLLGIGLLSGLSYLWITRSKFIFDITCLPLILVGILFLWVGIHYSFFSLDPVLEMKELKGIWLRSFGGVVLAFAFGFAIKNYKNLKLIFLLALVIIPSINLAVYSYQSLMRGQFIHPTEFVSQYLFNKIEVALFGSIAISAYIAYAFIILSKKLTIRNSIKLLFLYTLCFLTVLSSVASTSKNGVAISLGLMGLFCICITYLSIFRPGKRFAYLSSVIIILLPLLVVKNLHQDSATPGWKNLISDVHVGLQIEKYPNWKDPNKFGYPLNHHNERVAASPYERTSWAVAGIQLIAKEPFGYGSINNSFQGMLSRQKIEHNVPGQTHSGWIDFALGFGIPGILIIILSQLSIIYLGLKNKNEFSLIGVWICVALLPLGVIAEISYKQYFEATLFFITFAAVMVMNQKSIKS